MDFTHFDEKGNAIMVDVSSKDTTQRTAIAYGEICVGQEILEKIENHQMKRVMFFQWQELLELWQ